MIWSTIMKLPIKPYTLSRLTQLTFIILAVLSYLFQVVTLLRDDLTSGGPVLLNDPLMISALTFILTPLVIAAGVYVIQSRRVAKLWRVFQAVLLAYIGMMIKSLLDIVLTLLFPSMLGYGTTPTGQPVWGLYYVPMVLIFIIMTYVAVYVLKLRDVTKVTASPGLQVSTIAAMVIAPICFLSLSFGVSVVFNSANGGATALAILFEMLTPMLVLLVGAAILYVIASRKQPFLTRVFVASLYLSVGMLIAMMVSAIAGLVPGFYEYAANGMMIYLPEIIGLILFVVILVWHKHQKAF
jgi:hypothetical protein